MGRIGCVRGEKFRRDFVARTFALVRPNSPECNQIVRNAPKRQFRVQWGGSGAFVCEKFQCDFVARTFALVRPNSPECNKIVRNTPKRQFRVQRGGSGAFVAKNYNATSWHE